LFGQPVLKFSFAINIRYMLVLKYILLNLLCLSFLGDPPKDRTLFSPPVKIPVLLSANFGELRPDHYHSGIDIKTQGVIGKEIVSSADGYVYRISVSPSGFGKTLYLRHPSGYSTVYAHLDRFIPEIDEYVRAVQYERKSFLVNLFPPKERFPVARGQLIAYSGNSGSSGGPHLHFEVRESESELPVNPLLFDFGTTDNIAPVIERLAIYPVSEHTFINNSKSELKLGVRGSNGKYSVVSGSEITISGKAGFGIKLHDLLNGSANKCAAYSIELAIDSLPLFRYEMDQFAFAETRFINGHIDYPAWIRDNVRYQKTFVLPGDKFSAYKSVLNKGIYDFKDDRVHTVQITVADADNNKSMLSFKVRSVSKKPASKPAPAKSGTIMPFGKINRFNAENIALSIPAGALYDTLLFSYSKKPGTSSMLSDIHSVHDRYTPLHKAYSLSIKPTRIPAGKESKMLIIKMQENSGRTPVNATWSEGFLKADVSTFGDYFIGIDTLSPSIIPQNLTNGANLSGRKEIRIRIRDDFSGIKSYEPFIDDRWALMEYDPKNEMLIYTFDEKYITKGKLHSLTLRVSDNRDNEKTWSCEFTW
jgi:hypothetical protein